MSDTIAQVIYIAAGVISVGALIVMWTVLRTGWAPWDDDEAEAVEKPE